MKTATIKINQYLFVTALYTVLLNQFCFGQQFIANKSNFGFGANYSNSFIGNETKNRFALTANKEFKNLYFVNVHYEVPVNFFVDDENNKSFKLENGLIGVSTDFKVLNWRLLCFKYGGFCRNIGLQILPGVGVYKEFGNPFFNGWALETSLKSSFLYNIAGMSKAAQSNHYRFETSVFFRRNIGDLNSKFYGGLRLGILLQKYKVTKFADMY